MDDQLEKRLAATKISRQESYDEIKWIVDTWFCTYANGWCDTPAEEQLIKELVDCVEKSVRNQLITLLAEELLRSRSRRK